MSTTTTPTCTISARVEGPVTEAQARGRLTAVFTPCGEVAVAFSEADGHRSYYCETHAAKVAARGLYTRPVE